MKKRNQLLRRMHAAAFAFALCSAAFGITAWAAGPGANHSAEEMEHLSDNTLEWYEIDGLINEYNAAVVKNRNEFSKDERRSYNAAEVTSFLYDQAEEADSQADTMADSNAILAANFRTSANSLRMQAESNAVDAEVIKMQYEQIEKQTAHNARAAFLNYYSALAAKEYAETNVPYLERAYHSTVNKKNVGIATEINVLTAKEAWDNARANVLTTDSNIVKTRNALLVMCGWGFDSDAVIAGLPEISADVVSGIHYEEDKEKAFANNLTLKMDSRKLENAKHMGTALVVEQNQNQYNNDVSSFGINFKGAYDGLVTAQAAYANAVNDKNLGAQTLAASEKQLSLGMISAVDHAGAVNTYKALELAEKNAYINLILAKATYDDAVNGLI